VTYLVDTDEVSFLRRRSGSGFVDLMAKIAVQSASDPAFSIVSLHEQIMGAHPFIGRARDQLGFINGYLMILRYINLYNMMVAGVQDCVESRALSGGASFDPTDARKATVRRFGRSYRSALRCTSLRARQPPAPAAEITERRRPEFV
jgi:hypothetical protein